MGPGGIHRHVQYIPAGSTGQVAIQVEAEQNARVPRACSPIWRACPPKRRKLPPAHQRPAVEFAEPESRPLAANSPHLRDAAKRAERRLKGLRTNGDGRAGVRVAGDVWAVFEHIEPHSDRLPSWLDLTVLDDRFVASTLLR
ncbi:hypothetical protein AB0383_17080 [Amycolatopsis sp. NPDC051373]|uniref:hypothetical protein n=1 Tax=Amycolatopsis sp. NPDC051373 TaxID=3155801 RepID=UPI00345098C8